jgi:predicted nucleic acid-binding protein
MVLDASVVLEVLLRTPESDAITDRILGAGTQLYAPHTSSTWKSSGYYRYMARGQVTESRGREALDLLAVFPLTRYAHEPLLGRIWQLRERLTANDAAYVALAEALRVTLLTRDQRLARITGVRVTVQWA